MTRQRYPETFKIEAVKQITERGRPVADVARAVIPPKTRGDSYLNCQAIALVEIKLLVDVIWTHENNNQIILLILGIIRTYLNETIKKPQHHLLGLKH